MRSQAPLDEDIVKAFKELGLPETANFDDLRTKYKRLALEYHPDRNKDNKESSGIKFKSIQNAYEIIAKYLETKDHLTPEQYPELSPDYDWENHFKHLFKHGRTDATFGYRKMVTFEKEDLTLVLHGSNQLEVTKVNKAYAYLNEVIKEALKVSSLAGMHNIFAYLDSLNLTDEEKREVFSMRNERGNTLLHIIAKGSDSYNQIELQYALFKAAREVGYDFTLEDARGNTYHTCSMNKSPRRFNKKILDEFCEATKASYYLKSQNLLISLFEDEDDNAPTAITEMRDYYNKNKPTAPEQFILHFKKVIKDVIAKREQSFLLRFKYSLTQILQRTKATENLYAAITNLHFITDEYGYLESKPFKDLEEAVAQYKKISLKDTTLALQAPDAKKVNILEGSPGSIPSDPEVNLILNIIREAQVPELQGSPDKLKQDPPVIIQREQVPETSDVPLTNIQIDINQEETKEKVTSNRNREILISDSEKNQPDIFENIVMEHLPEGLSTYDVGSYNRLRKKELREFSEDNGISFPYYKHKLHLSIDTSNPIDYEKTCALLTEIFQEECVYEVKIFNPLEDKRKFQLGKEAVLYFIDNNPALPGQGKISNETYLNQHIEVMRKLDKRIQELGLPVSIIPKQNASTALFGCQSEAISISPPEREGEKYIRAENRDANWENPYLTPAICKKALQQDIIKYKDRTDFEKPIRNALIRAIIEAQESSDFMASIANSCKSIVFDFMSISANNNDYNLCLALADSKKLLQKWPHISTFEGLVCAAQKLEAINQIHMSLLESPHKENAKDLLDQIDGSDVSTTIYDILRPGSLFLEVKGYDKIFKGELESLARHYKYLDPKIIVGDLTKETYKAKRRSHLENLNIHAELIKTRQDLNYTQQGYGLYTDEVDVLVKGVTQTLTGQGEPLDRITLQEKLDKIAHAYETEEMAWAKMNTELAHALRDLKIDYKARGRQDHRDEIDTLIQNVASFDKNNNLSHKQRFSRIISEIQRVYDIEKSNYINKFIIFERTPESFEARLKENDNRYCYPRGLKAILDNFKPYQNILKLEAQKEELPQMKKGKSK